MRGAAPTSGEPDLRHHLDRHWLQHLPLGIRHVRRVHPSPLAQRQPHAAHLASGADWG